MLDFTIKVETPATANALSILFDNYKENFVVFLNNVLKNEVGSCDVFITKDEEGVFQVWENAPDKGRVLAQIDGGITFTDYTSLEDETKYVMYDGQYLTLFVKQPKGTPDLKIGRFANFNDVVEQIDSESVLTAIQTVRSAVANAAVERKNLEKKIEKAKKAVEREVKNDK